MNNPTELALTVADAISDEAPFVLTAVATPAEIDDWGAAVLRTLALELADLIPTAVPWHEDFGPDAIEGWNACRNWIIHELLGEAQNDVLGHVAARLREQANT